MSISVSCNYVIIKTNDTVFLKDLLHGVFNMKGDVNEIEKMYRLGRWSEDNARPLLVAFRNVEQKIEYIMANLRNLRQPKERTNERSLFANEQSEQ